MTIENNMTWDEACNIEWEQLFSTISKMDPREVTNEQWHRLYVLDGNLQTDCECPESLWDFKDRIYEQICEMQMQERFEQYYSTPPHLRN